MCRFTNQKSDEVEKNAVAKGSPKPYETCWMKFDDFSSDNELEDPSLITRNTVKNAKPRLALGFKTAEGTRSGVRSHRSRNLKLDDGWSGAARVGNPCDSNKAKDHIASIKKIKVIRSALKINVVFSLARGKVSKRF